MAKILEMPLESPAKSSYNLEENLEKLDKKLDKILDESSKNNLVNKDLDRNLSKDLDKENLSKEALELEKIREEKRLQSQLHKDHRARLRKRYLESGLDSFAPHEALELLLFYAIPYRDTNGLAHELLDHYGSFAQVLDANYEDLLENKGIGENSACLLKLISDFSRYYEKSKWENKISLSTISQGKEFVKSLFIGRNVETFFLLHLNSKSELIYADIINEGTVSEVPVQVANVVKSALKYNARAVFLAHNHPGGVARPTSSDLELTKACSNALLTVGVSTLDHFVVANDNVYSFAENNLMIFPKNTK